jgi:Protein of unknown function (DUF2971)
MTEDLPMSALLPLRTLYHYTTQAGLLGILTSKSIWASEIRFLNDATEFRTALETVGAELRNRLNDLDSKEARERGEAIFREFTVLEESSVFALALTEKGDDLSQWRAYGGKHSGFALGFDVDRLTSLAAEHEFSLERCFYEGPEHSLLTETIVDAALAWLDEGDRMTRRRRREFRRTMLKTAPLLKDYSFHDESEWRLVSASHDVTSPDIGFRSGPSTLIPYYSLPLIALDGSTPLSSVTVGPTPHADLAIQSTCALLRARGFKDAFIYESRIPLRTW